MRENTEKRDEKIRSLRRQGMRRREIAQEMLCSVSVVDRACRSLDEGLRRASFERHKEEIIELYRKGIPVPKIAEKTGLTENTINRNMRAMDKGRGRGWNKGIKSGPRGPQVHRATCEEQEPVPLFMAPAEYRRARHITVRGKTWLDVSDWYL